MRWNKLDVKYVDI